MQVYFPPYCILWKHFWELSVLRACDGQRNVTYNILSAGEELIFYTLLGLASTVDIYITSQPSVNKTPVSIRPSQQRTTHWTHLLT